MEIAWKSALVAVAALFSQPGLAQQQTTYGAELEILPDHIVRRILADAPEQAIRDLQTSGRVQQGVIVGAKRWQSGSPVSVCFFGGNTQVRRRIVEVASLWEQQGAPLSFDFGDRSNPNICRLNRAYDIRIGYSMPGYWSMIGQDSLIHVGQHEQSMNLARFDYAPPSELEFSRVVLHEFGHALGFTHEHQQSGACENEFNWPVIYRYLQGPPNNWSNETINFNMRSRPYMAGDVKTDFNPQSIMLYSFPIEFYNQGAQSRCYSGSGNHALSPGDANLLKVAYGSGAPSRASQGAALLAAASALPASDQAQLRERLRFFNANQVTKNQILRIGNAKFTDVDIQACSTNAATLQLVEEVSQALNAEPRLGLLRYRGIASGQTHAEGVTILADADHPEIADARRVQKALTGRFANVRLDEFPGQNRWLLNVVVCAGLN